jgi:plasmid replication initiation protein
VTEKIDRIRKSNKLTQARFRLSLNEYRLLLHCVTKIEPMTDQISGTFRIYGKEYARMFGISENNAYKQIREGLDATWNREFYEWLPKGKKKQPGWVRRRFVITQEYNPSEGYGSLQLHPEFLQHLVDLREQYTDYALRNVRHMGSFNAIRMYEFLAQYRKIGRCRFTVAWFVDILELDGRYPRWSDLRKHVIDPALKQIHANTDISVIKSDSGEWVTTQKRGRTVISFDVCFEHKAQQVLALDEDEDEDVPEKQPEWIEKGYASPGEYHEAGQLERTYGVRFSSAREFLYYRGKLSKD